MPLSKTRSYFLSLTRMGHCKRRPKSTRCSGAQILRQRLNDALLVVDLDPKSPTYSQRVGEVKMPKVRPMELHHFGWSACSSHSVPYSPHPHVERRYLVVPGLRSSRLHIIDTKPDHESLRCQSESNRRTRFCSRQLFAATYDSFADLEAIYVSALSADGGGPAVSSCSIARHSRCLPVGDESRPSGSFITISGGLGS